MMSVLDIAGLGFVLRLQDEGYEVLAIEGRGAFRDAYLFWTLNRDPLGATLEGV